MISQEQFDSLESQYGCGYWNVCWEHACPCAITTEDKGLQESIYYALDKEAKDMVDNMNDDDLNYDNWDIDYEDDYDDDRLPCGCCRCCGCSCDDNYLDFEGY